MPHAALRSKPAAAYRRALILLTQRDLKVRYTTSFLGYIWSVLDPLLMSLIYWFVFTQVFERSVGTTPYIVFLLTALLPWVWFNNAVSDSTRAFLRDVKLVRSVALPRSLWVHRIVASKGIEFLLSLPVLAAFCLFAGVHPTPMTLLYLPLAVGLQSVLLAGIGLFLAPLVVFFRDLERATKLILRVLFYASPIIYSTRDLPEPYLALAGLNPLSGIFSLYRAGLFPDEFNLNLILTSTATTLLLLLIGVLTFNRTIGNALKEL